MVNLALNGATNLASTFSQVNGTVYLWLVLPYASQFVASFPASCSWNLSTGVLTGGAVLTETVNAPGTTGSLAPIGIPNYTQPAFNPQGTLFTKVVAGANNLQILAN